MTTPIDKIGTAKTIRTEYGRGWRSWAEARRELIKLGFTPIKAAGVLLGTAHLLGD